MFCAPGLVFGGKERVGSHFHVLHSRTRFRRCRVRRVPFSCFARRTSFRRYRWRRVAFSRFAPPDSFSAVPMASCCVFMFFPPGLVFGGAEGVGSRFHVLTSQTRFRWYRGRRVPFSYFPLLDMFLAVPRASVSFFTFCAPGLVFGGAEGVGSRFYVLRALNHFRRYRSRQDPFSFFPRSYSFSAVPMDSGPVFMFCAPGLIFVGTDGVGSRFHVLRFGTHFRRYRRHRVPFSCFALLDSFSAVPRASALVFMF
jgi:hypothetical protein